MAPRQRLLQTLWRGVRNAPAVRRAVEPRLRPAPPRDFLAAPVPEGLPWRFTPERVDEWACLHDLESAEAQQLLADEAAAAAEFFKGTEEFERNLQAEAAYLLQPEESTVPEEHGPYQYYERYTPDGFVVFCRAPRGGGPEEVLLNTSKLADEAGFGYAEVAACKVSDDHGTLAYIVDTRGDESYELRFKTVGLAGAEWTVTLPGVRSMEFLGRGDASTAVDILAVYADPQTHRACRIDCLRVAPERVVEGSQHTLWNELREAAYLEVFRTKNRQFVLLSSNTKDTSEVRAIRCCRPAVGDAIVGCKLRGALLARREGVEYFAEHHEGHFLVISNHERPDFAAYWLPEGALGAEDGGWPQLIPFFTPPGAFHITDADLLEKWLILYGHEEAGPRICVVPLLPGAGKLRDGTLPAPAVAGEPYFAPLPGTDEVPVGSVEPGVNPEPTAAEARFTFRSPIEPGANYSLNLATAQLRLVSQRQWGTGLDPGEFLCERVEYPARDGQMVPLSLARQRHPRGGGVNLRPCLLHVYGAYGSVLTPDFRPEHMALLRRGWVLAWAHIRGGGELGRAWHSAGRELRKAQSVRDLADAVKFLLARSIATPGALCLKAASAGGLTLAALLNQPDEAKCIAAAVLEVPFVDALTGMLDTSLPLTVHEFSEWGDPRNPLHENNLRSLSPYENVGSHQYPQLYFSCARIDSRVPAWMPLKLVARLRARAPGAVGTTSPAAAGGARGARRRQVAVEGAEARPEDCKVVLHCLDGGHAGAVDWHGRTEEFARQIAFLYKALGLLLQ